MTDTHAPAAAAPAPAPQKRTKLVIVLVLSMAVLASGGAAAFWLSRRPAAAPEGSAASAPAEAAHGLVSLEPFVVNLADPGGAHFLRVSIRLIVESEEQAQRIQKNDVLVTRLRSAILEVLTQQTGETLLTSAGKEALKKAIAGRAGEVLQDLKVSDVLFSDFVVQF